MRKGNGIVKHEGYKGSMTRGKGMRNKRKSKKAKMQREEIMNRLRRQREIQEREESWLEEWGHLAGGEEY